MDAFMAELAHPAWIWLGLGLGLLILELWTGTLFLLGPGMAALLLAALTALAPEFSTTAQLITFAAFAVGLTVIGRNPQVRQALQRDTDRPLLNNKAQQLVGRRVTALAAFQSGEGPVRLNDTQYLARLADGGADPVAEGAVLEIRGMAGVILLVAPLPSDEAHSAA